MAAKTKAVGKPAKSTIPQHGPDKKAIRAVLRAHQKGKAAPLHPLLEEYNRNPKIALCAKALNHLLQQSERHRGRPLPAGMVNPVL